MNTLFLKRNFYKGTTIAPLNFSLILFKALSACNLVL